MLGIKRLYVDCYDGWTVMRMFENLLAQKNCRRTVELPTICDAMTFVWGRCNVLFRLNIMVYGHVYIEISRHISHNISNALKKDWINVRATELAVCTEPGCLSLYFQCFRLCTKFCTRDINVIVVTCAAKFHCDWPNMEWTTALHSFIKFRIQSK